MKQRVLALDYDGTIAREGVLDPDVHSAIQEIRTHGIIVIIITGRIVSDLQRAIGDLRIVDAVVGENGAMIAIPASGRMVRLGQPPPEPLLAELRRRNIEVTVGSSVIEADASLACRITDTIRELQLPWIIAFNRGRLMVLPQSISKGSGLREALRILRLSVHNALAIGDAENDHELLTTCEVGVAVAWGSLPLQSVADAVIAGDGPHHVAPYIRQLTAQERLPPRKASKHTILLGNQTNGEPLSLAIWGRNVLIGGHSRTGKSSLAGVLVEQLILQGYCVCVIDPEGDHESLESLPGVIIRRIHSSDEAIDEVIRVLRYPDNSLVIDLSVLTLEERCLYGTMLLRAVAAIRRQTGLPHRVMVDEAHYFLHEAGSRDLLAYELAGYTLVTYRASELDADVRALSEVVIITSDMDPQEAQTLVMPYCSSEQYADMKTLLRQLPVDAAVLLPGVTEAPDVPRQFRIATRLTSHVRHRHKYLDVPVGDERAFVFTLGDEPTGQRARTLREFVVLLSDLPESAAVEHMKRGDFSRWVDDVFNDVSTAASIREIEAQICCKSVSALVGAVQKVIEKQYGVSEGFW